MKRKVILLLCACMLAFGAESVLAESTENQTEVQTEAVPKTIGTATEGGFEETLKNLTGKNIKSVTVKATMDEDYCDNLLEEGDIYGDGEERIFYYPQAKIEDGSGRISAYDIKFVFEDDTEAVIHTFPFNDMKNGELHLEEPEAETEAETGAETESEAMEQTPAVPVAYLVFDSISQGKSINTLGNEKAGALTSDQVYYYGYAEEEYFSSGSGSSGGGNGGGKAGGAACLTGGLIN